MTKIVKKRIKRMKREASPTVEEPVEEITMYYLTRTGALFLEEKYPNMILTPEGWKEKPKNPKKWKGSSKTSTVYPPKVLRDGKWVEKPK